MNTQEVIKNRVETLLPNETATTQEVLVQKLAEKNFVPDTGLRIMSNLFLFKAPGQELNTIYIDA